MDRIPNQIISLEGRKYAIPQENLKELVRIPAAEVKNKIDKVGNLPVIKLRQEFLPLIDLADVLGLQKTYSTVKGEKQADRRKQISDRRSFQHLPESRAHDLSGRNPFNERQKENRRTSPASAANIVIVSSGEFKYGIVVDKLHDSETFEILPLGRYLSGCSIYMGTAILNDERASLVLDILNIAYWAGLSQILEKVGGSVSEKTAAENPDLESYSLLTFRNCETECFAVEIDFVERLERFKSSDFEKVGKEKVIQYRGGALPLFELSQVLSCASLFESEIQEVLVLRHNSFLVGLKVTPPVDTYNDRLVIDQSTFDTSPIMGSAILNGHTTLMLDVPAMVSTIKGRSRK